MISMLKDRHSSSAFQAGNPYWCKSFVLFRGLIAVALRVGLDPIDLKLATAAFVLATLALPRLGIGRRLGGAAR